MAIVGHTAVVVLIQADETICQRRVHDFVDRTHQHILVDGDEVEIVEKCKYLGATIDSGLTWNTNTDDICKKGQQRLHLHSAQPEAVWGG